MRRDEWSDLRLQHPATMRAAAMIVDERYDDA